MIGLI